jgi:hypothetical protein
MPDLSPVGLADRSSNYPCAGFCDKLDMKSGIGVVRNARIPAKMPYMCTRHQPRSILSKKEAAPYG